MARAYKFTGSSGGRVNGGAVWAFNIIMSASWSCLAFLLLSLVESNDALKVAVTGATGNVGRRVVQNLVANGAQAKILLRHAVQEEGLSSSDLSAPPPADADSKAVARYLVNLAGVEAVKGDINDQASLDALLAGCSAVIAAHGARRTRKLSDFWIDPTTDPSHAKNVNYEGVRKLLAAARASQACKRIVRITGKGEEPWSIFSILINGLGGMAKAWNNEGERLLRAAEDVDYTIIRPGVMRGSEEDLAENSLQLADDGGDLKVTAIPHGSIAKLCVEALDYPNAARTTLTAMQSEVPGSGADTWKELLAGVQPDRREFRTDLLASHFTAVRVGCTALALALGSIAFGLATAMKVIWVKLAALLFAGK